MNSETQVVDAELEPIACPLCGEDRSTELVRANDRRCVTPKAFRLVRCGCCSLVYQNPRVRPASIGRYYAGDYYTALRSEGSQPRERRKRHIVQGIGVRVGTLLDVGCASGDFLVEMQENGWTVEGVEFSEEPARFCRDQRHLKVATGQLLDRPEDGTRFDLITMWAVLPHLPDPVPVVRHATALLRPGGVLLVCVANIESWAYRIRGGDWGHLDQPRHYCMYAPATVRRLLEGCGLSVGPVMHDERVERSQIVVPPLGTLRRLIARAPRGRFRNVATRALHFVNRPLAAPLEHLACRLGYGGVIIATGIRP